jgi:hypothetical protein
LGLLRLGLGRFRFWLGILGLWFRMALLGLGWFLGTGLGRMESVLVCAARVHLRLSRLQLRLVQ